MTQRTLLLVLICALAVLAAPAISAHADDADDTEGTLAGCLNADGENGQFVLTTEEGETVAVTGGDDIAAHAENHKVELTGRWVEDGEGGKHFDAASVAHQGVCD